MFLQNPVKAIVKKIRSNRPTKCTTKCTINLCTESIFDASTNNPVLREFQMLCSKRYPPCKTLICTRTWRRKYYRSNGSQPPKKPVNINFKELQRNMPPQKRITLDSAFNFSSSSGSNSWYSFSFALKTVFCSSASFNFWNNSSLVSSSCCPA